MIMERLTEGMRIKRGITDEAKRVRHRFWFRLSQNEVNLSEDLLHGVVTDGNTLIQKYLHAGASSDCSDRSRIRHAISRVTDGKHSRNSSSE